MTRHPMSLAPEMVTGQCMSPRERVGGRRATPAPLSKTKNHTTNMTMTTWTTSPFIIDRTPSHQSEGDRLRRLLGQGLNRMHGSIPTRRNQSRCRLYRGAARHPKLILPHGGTALLPGRHPPRTTAHQWHHSGHLHYVAPVHRPVCERITGQHDLIGPQASEIVTTIENTGRRHPPPLLEVMAIGTETATRIGTRVRRSGALAGMDLNPIRVMGVGPVFMEGMEASTQDLVVCLWQVVSDDFTSRLSLIFASWSRSSLCFRALIL